MLCSKASNCSVEFLIYVLVNRYGLVGTLEVAINDAQIKTIFAMV